MSTNPTTPDETEALAKKLVSEYLTAEATPQCSQGGIKP